MPRLFSAIEIPAIIAERLTLLRAGLSGARWIDPENYHLTLRFIGDVDGHMARDFTAALGEIVAAAIRSQAERPGQFRRRQAARDLCRIEPSEGLERCAAPTSAPPARPGCRPRAATSSRM